LSRPTFCDTIDTAGTKIDKQVRADRQFQSSHEENSLPQYATQLKWRQFKMECDDISWQVHSIFFDSNDMVNITKFWDSSNDEPLESQV